MDPTKKQVTYRSPAPFAGGATLGAALLLAGACGAPPEEAEPVAEQRGEIHENQGTSVLGTFPIDLSVKFAGAQTVGGKLYSGVGLAGANLVFEVSPSVSVSGDAKGIAGSTFAASDGSTLRIVSVCPHYRPPKDFVLGPTNIPSACGLPEGEGWTLNPGEYEYEIEVTPSGGGPPKPLCSDGWNRAIPVAGTWDKVGWHAPSGTDFSFACNGATVRKCADWEYKPWQSPELFEAHQACTRLARADYCGKNMPHTFPGTPIDVYDDPTSPPVASRVNLPAAAPDDYSFEAGWLPGRALCLSKTRWSIFPPDYCGGSPPDPRKTGRHEDACDSRSAALGKANAMTGRPALLLHSESGDYEAGLYVWKNPATSRYRTTTAGFYGGNLTGAGATTVPAPGYNVALYAGMVFKKPLTGTTKLVTCQDLANNRYFTTTLTACPAAYPDGAVEEGYVYDPSAEPKGLPPHLAKLVEPLDRFCNGGPGNCVTTTLTPPAGYNFAQREGYVIVFK